MTDMTANERVELRDLIGSLIGDALASDLVLCFDLDAQPVSLETDAAATHMLAAVRSTFHDLTGDIPAHVVPMMLRELADALESGEYRR